MPTPHITLDGRSLTIDDVVRIAREPGTQAVAAGELDILAPSVPVPVSFDR